MYMLEVSKSEVNTVQQQLYNEIDSKFTISKNIIHCIIEKIAIKVMWRKHMIEYFNPLFNTMTSLLL